MSPLFVATVLDEDDAVLAPSVEARDGAPLVTAAMEVVTVVGLVVVDVVVVEVVVLAVVVLSVTLAGVAAKSNSQGGLGFDVAGVVLTGWHL